MSMNVKIGNIFEHVTSGIIVHGCNSHGVMGSGIAAEVKRRFPEAFNLYRQHCEQYGLGNETLLGTCPAWTNATASIDVSKDLVVINAITQLNYGRLPNTKYVSYKAVKECFDNIAVVCKTLGADGIHFPLIGAGLGGGDWAVISSIISDSMRGFNQTLWILE